MYGYTAPARHEPDDGVGRRRLAASGRHGEELIDADDQYAARLRARLADDRRLVDCGGRRFVDAQCSLYLARADFTAADLRQKIVELGEFKFVRELFEADTGHAEALQFLVDDIAPFRHRDLVVEPIEPLPDFAARARALQKTQRRIQPVAAGAALLRRDDFDLLAVLQRRIERHHRAVDTGAAAAVAEIGVHVICEIHW